MAEKVQKKLKIETVKGNGVGAIEILEQTFFLLRENSLRTLPIYFLGTMPFAFALMFFINDMSSAVPTSSMIANSALILTILYFLKNGIQSLFCRKLFSLLNGGEGERIARGHLFRLFFVQTIAQTIGCFVQCLCSVIVAPVGVSTAFLSSFFCIAGVNNESTASLVRRTWRSALYEQKQNHVILMVISAMTFAVSLNIAILIFLIPGFLNMFLGIQTVFNTISGYDFFLSTIGNSTFWSIVLVGTYLVVDPFIKTVYTVRSFYSESEYSGADIMADIHTFKSKAVLGLTALLICFAPYESLAQTGNEVLVARDKVEVIDQAIDETLALREYRWREFQIREASDEEESVIFEYIKSCVETVGDWLEWFFDLIDEWFGDSDSQPSSTGGFAAFLQNNLQLILYSLSALVIGIILYYVIRGWKRKHRVKFEVGEIAEVAVDLNDEALTADVLEEDQWLELAEQLISEGRFREALRALFLSALASLADRKFLNIAKFKTTRDYQRELARRCHSNSAVIEAFSGNVFLFERGWYGEYTVDLEIIEQIKKNNSELSI